MKTTRHEKLRVAVMLCMAAHDNKLPLYDVRNTKQKDGAESKFLQRYNSWGPKYSWMTMKLMEDWLGRVWERRTGTPAMGAFVAISPTE
jgi:hypothetical protein